MTSAHSLPRSTALVRLLLQLRIALTAMAVLLLLSNGRLDLTVLLLAIAYALLTALVAWQWQVVAPQIQHHPVLVTSDIACAFFILTVAGPAGPFFFATVLTSAVAGIIFAVRGVLLVAAFQVFCYLGALTAPGAALGFQEVVIHPLMYVGAGYVGLRLSRIFARLAAEQAGRRDAERAAAAAEERARLARDMHDSVAKTLRGTALAAQALPIWLARDPQRARETALEVARAADTAAMEARQLLEGLRSESPVRFADAVRDTAQRWSRETGIPVETAIEAEDADPGGIARYEALAILREALTNVERHAAAAQVRIALRGDDGHAELSVTDDGRGFGFTHPPAGHYGIRGMRERAEHAGAALTIDSSPNSGTVVRLRIPLMLLEAPP
ncbi:sensor histidine kinase [Spiractinospora alimapuensis]|uniref:sensor histidine kinase n=1 Tax=Spiractinospora alimapuensis TaxID=2820884 RepID=UPI001F47C6EC|nr:histidine kinase [Spiractinospora alimapuensis]